MSVKIASVLTSVGLCTVSFCCCTVFCSGVSELGASKLSLSWLVLGLSWIVLTCLGPALSLSSVCLGLSGAGLGRSGESLVFSLLSGPAWRLCWLWVRVRSGLTSRQPFINKWSFNVFGLQSELDWACLGPVLGCAGPVLGCLVLLCAVMELL